MLMWFERRASDVCGCGLREELRMCADEGCVMGFGCVLMWLV